MLDESGSDVHDVLLANVCLLEYERRISPWIGACAEARAGVADAWRDYCRWTLAEQLQLRSNADYSPQDFERHCDKVAFARVPLLVLMTLRGEFAAELVRALVHALGVSYGLTNDLRGLGRDIANGHRTYLLARAGFDLGAGQSVADIEAQVYARGLVEQTVEESRAWLERARKIAEELDLRGFDDFALERARMLENILVRARLARLQWALKGPMP